jgi:DNA repair protein RecN (Recombination protein N)
VVGTNRPGATRRVARTFIFDEVDSGIGGRVAESIGQRLKRLAHDGQVLCVTHLAQIACFADQHYYVEKFERAGRTLTAVTHLAAEKERVRELARMLSGSQITDAALKHATTMLRQAAG